MGPLPEGATGSLPGSAMGLPPEGAMGSLTGAPTAPEPVRHEPETPAQALPMDETASPKAARYRARSRYRTPDRPGPGRTKAPLGSRVAMRAAALTALAPSGAGPPVAPHEPAPHAHAPRARGLGCRRRLPRFARQRKVYRIGRVAGGPSGPLFWQHPTCRASAPGVPPDRDPGRRPVWAHQQRTSNPARPGREQR